MGSYLVDTPSTTRAWRSCFLLDASIHCTYYCDDVGGAPAGTVLDHFVGYGAKNHRRPKLDHRSTGWTDSRVGLVVYACLHGLYSFPVVAIQATANVWTLPILTVVGQIQRKRF